MILIILVKFVTTGDLFMTIPHINFSLIFIIFLTFQYAFIPIRFILIFGLLLHLKIGLTLKSNFY